MVQFSTFLEFLNQFDVYTVSGPFNPPRLSALSTLPASVEPVVHTPFDEHCPLYTLGSSIEAQYSLVSLTIKVGSQNTDENHASRIESPHPLVFVMLSIKVRGFATR